MKQRIYHLINLLGKETNKKVMLRENDERKGFIRKIKNGLKEMKYSFKHQDLNHKQEIFFCKTFLQSYLSKDKKHEIYILINHDNEKQMWFDLEGKKVLVSDNILAFLKDKFNMNDDDAESFMMRMLDKYFEIDEWSLTSRGIFMI